VRPRCCHFCCQHLPSGDLARRDGNWDPDENLERYSELSKGNSEPMTTIYSIITTEKGRASGIALP
jgi:hypothetical protein